MTMTSKSPLLVACPRRLIPRFDGAIYSLEWKEALWDKFVTVAPRPRTLSELQHSDRKLRPRRLVVNSASMSKRSLNGASARRLPEVNGIEHRLIKPNNPWTNGRVERMNRTIKEGEADRETVRGIVSPLNDKRFHCDNHDQLRTHLTDFMAAYNFARRLKTVSYLTPNELSAKSGHQSQTNSS
jgi:transposase InsO family protein